MLIKREWASLTFLRGGTDFWDLHLGVRRSGDFMNLLDNGVSAVCT